MVDYGDKNLMYQFITLRVTDTVVHYFQVKGKNKELLGFLDESKMRTLRTNKVYNLYNTFLTIKLKGVEEPCRYLILFLHATKCYRDYCAIKSLTPLFTPQVIKCDKSLLSAYLKETVKVSDTT